MCFVSENPKENVHRVDRPIPWKSTFTNSDCVYFSELHHLLPETECPHLYKTVLAVFYRHLQIFEQIKAHRLIQMIKNIRYTYIHFQVDY